MDYKHFFKIKNFSSILSNKKDILKNFSLILSNEKKYSSEYNSA